MHGRVVVTHSTVRAQEREARCADRTPPRESLARKPIRGKTSTREFHCRRDFPGHIRHGVESSGDRIFMSKNDLTSVPKVKTSVIAAKRTKARLAKLRTSSWYEGAAQLGSTKEGRPKSATGEGSALALPCHELRNTSMSQGGAPYCRYGAK